MPSCQGTNPAYQSICGKIPNPQGVTTNDIVVHSLACWWLHPDMPTSHLQCCLTEATLLGQTMYLLEDKDSLTLDPLKMFEGVL